jgi:two-component system LytT family sensor kinase
MQQLFTIINFLKTTTKIILHIFFWLVVLTFFTYFFGFQSEDSHFILSYSLFLMPATIATTYVAIYKLIPDYLITKQYFKFCLYSFYTFIISTYLIIVSIFFGLIFLSRFEYENMSPLSRNIFFVMLAVYSIIILVSAFKLLSLNLKYTKETKRLETKILETQLKLKEQELHYLKMQIHPHFLFNTLNTLYGFALKKADDTPEMILKLSNLLDYLLYQTNKPFVALKEDINHIEDYIDLEKMRFNDRISIDFNYESISENTTIPPMLLIPFIENSFKHGYLKDGVLKIKMNLTSSNSHIYFQIENSYKNTISTSQGIGLPNIEKRLKLLYGDQYILKTTTENDLFKVSLHLPLNT